MLSEREQKIFDEAFGMKESRLKMYAACAAIKEDVLERVEKAIGEVLWRGQYDGLTWGGKTVNDFCACILARLARPAALEPAQPEKQSSESAQATDKCPQCCGGLGPLCPSCAIHDAGKKPAHTAPDPQQAQDDAAVVEEMIDAYERAPGVLQYAAMTAALAVARPVIEAEAMADITRYLRFRRERRERLAQLKAQEAPRE